MPARRQRGLPRATTGERRDASWPGDFPECVAGEHLPHLHRRAGFARLLHRLHQRDSDDALGHVGLWRRAGLEAAREILDVVLVFAGMVRMPAEAEEMRVLVLERFNDRLRVGLPRVAQLVVVALAG